MVLPVNSSAGVWEKWGQNTRLGVDCCVLDMKIVGHAYASAMVLQVQCVHLLPYGAPYNASSLGWCPSRQHLRSCACPPPLFQPSQANDHVVPHFHDIPLANPPVPCSVFIVRPTGNRRANSNLPRPGLGP